MESLYVKSRTLEAKDLKWIRRLIDGHPGWNRTKLSRHIAQRWEKSSRAAQGYGLPLDAPKTGAKRLGLLAGPPEALQ
jgi:hypothetical protein